jgi:hypothetical protein
MLGISDTDLIFSISQYSTDCIYEYYNEVGINMPFVTTSAIPGEFMSSPRITDQEPPDGDCIQFTFISTLEPRKNHRVIIDACIMLEEKQPELNFKFVMIGNWYPGHFYIAEYAQSVSEKLNKVQWLGVVDDEVLKEEVRKSTFTVYGSYMEGFGLPILESIWQGKPCLCHNEGSMGELAAGGGCYAVDITNVDNVCNALYRLCTDTALIERLTKEAVDRRLKTWDEYAFEILKTMFHRQSDINGQALPDRKYGMPVKSLCSQVSALEDPLLTIIKSLSIYRHSVAITLGISDEESLACLANRIDLVFADIDNNINILPENVITLRGDKPDTISLIKRRAEESGFKISLICIDFAVASIELLSSILKSISDAGYIVVYRSLNEQNFDKFIPHQEKIIFDDHTGVYFNSRNAE